jgi:hypothetical protein
MGFVAETAEVAGIGPAAEAGGDVGGEDGGEAAQEAPHAAIRKTTSTNSSM